MGDIAVVTAHPTTARDTTDASDAASVLAQLPNLGELYRVEVAQSTLYIVPTDTPVRDLSIPSQLFETLQVADVIVDLANNRVVKNRFSA